MGRECIEVTAQGLNVRLEVGHRLGAIHQGQYPLFFRLFNQGRNWVDGAQRVGHVGDRQHPGALVQQAVERIQIQLALRCHLDGHNPGTGALGHHLPGHNVGVVFHVADQNLIAGFQARGQAIGHQVDGFGGASGPDDFSGAGRVQKLAHGFPGAFKRSRRTITQGMGATVHIGVHLAVIAIHGIQHGLWLLRRRAVVQIHQRLPVDLLIENREVTANGLHIKHH